MQISSSELAGLNFYRASELHGGLVLGQLVRRVRDPRLILALTRHSAEEIVHAQLWSETILAVNGRPSPVRETYQRRLARRVGAPASVFQVLALTQVFERRVYRHFMAHAQRADTHPLVRATLRRMIAEERHHLSWVKAWLDEEGARRRADVRALLEAYAAADAIVYRSFIEEYDFHAPGRIEQRRSPAARLRDDSRVRRLATHVNLGSVNGIGAERLPPERR